MVVVPIIVGVITVPNLWQIYCDAPLSAVIVPILLGSLYGFGGMAFGFAIREIGYSLTYTISIGISAIIGTIVPLLHTNSLISKMFDPGGDVFFAGMFVSFIGLIFCGYAGYSKERDLAKSGDNTKKFNMTKGVGLTLFAGILSGIFGVALFLAQPVADMAEANGAGHYQANALRFSHRWDVSSPILFGLFR